MSFGYSSTGFLETITYPDGIQSTFSRSYDSTKQCTKVHYHDIAGKAAYRDKDMYVTNNVTIRSHANEKIMMTPQAAGICRLVTNGEGKVLYTDAADPDDSEVVYIYNGGGKVVLRGFVRGRKYGTWDWVDPGDKQFTWDKIDFTGESTYNQWHYPNTRAKYLARPNYKIDKTGRRKDYQYNAAGSVTQVTRHADSTVISKKQYNAMELVTRSEDEFGRVVKFSYDANGNMLTREVGITVVDGSDVQQDEYAKYEWRYYDGTEGPAITTGRQYVEDRAADPQPENLKKSETDANGNTTYFIYDSDSELIAVVEPDDGGTGHHVKVSYAYYSSGNIKNTTDAVGGPLSREPLLLRSPSRLPPQQWLR